MSDDVGKKLRVDWLAVMLAGGSLIYNFAITSQQVSQNKVDISALKADVRDFGGTMSRIDARTARIEVTLDIITGRTPIQHEKGAAK